MLSFSEKIKIGKTIILVSYFNVYIMCLQPIKIYNPSKYISLKHGDAFFLSVPCGHCAECAEQKSNEWYFRSFQHMMHTLKSGGYILFDTLTYDNEHLPKLSDFMDTTNDFPCFSRDDIRKFFVRLRRKLAYNGYKDSFTYFLTSEYGELRHRPHYHVLFYLPSSIPPLVMSQYIHDTWQKGRCDGVFEYGSRYVLQNRVFNDMSAHGMQLCNYVSKYVQKDCQFDKVIKARITAVLDDKFRDVDLDDYSNYAEYKSMRTKLYNLVGQFHLQSKGFGLSFISDVDKDRLFESGMISMIVPKVNILKHIPLPTYYNRHLFQRCIEVNGKKCWEYTPEGVAYRVAIKPRLVANLVNRLRSWQKNLSLLTSELKVKVLIPDDFDFCSFANYVLFERGRYRTADYCPLSAKLNDIDYFHYGSLNDAIIYGRKFVSPVWLGNDVSGYDCCTRFINRSNFGKAVCKFNPDYEFIYDYYIFTSGLMNMPKQSTYEYKQRLNHIYKTLLERVL